MTRAWLRGGGRSLLATALTLGGAASGLADDHLYSQAAWGVDCPPAPCAPAPCPPSPCPPIGQGVESAPMIGTPAPSVVAPTPADGTPAPSVAPAPAPAPMPSQDFSQPAPAPVSVAPGAAIASSAASSALSALPNVQGDLAFGTCASADILGLSIDIGHPNLACSRINLAENNSPIPFDRVFFTYRHFEAATSTNVFSGADTDEFASFGESRSKVDVDRFLLGIEKTFWDGVASIEVRIPFNNQLSSELGISYNDLDTSGDFTPGSSEITGVPITSDEFDLGNVSLALKAILKQGRCYVVSSGLGLALPTGASPSLRGSLNATSFSVGEDGTDFGDIDLEVDFRGTAVNEIVNLTPFIAYTVRPENSFWFSQGFMQLDVPLGSQRLYLDLAAAGDASGVRTDTSETFFGPGRDVTATEYIREFIDLEIEQQVLLRLNQQFGAYVYQNPNGKLKSLAGLFEIHYTGAISGNALDSETIIASGEVPGLTDDIAITVGNQDDSVHVVNLVFGTSAQVGKTFVDVGYVQPVTGDRGFDWEFYTGLNRRF